MCSRQIEIIRKDILTKYETNHPDFEKAVLNFASRVKPTQTRLTLDSFKFYFNIFVEENKYTKFDRKITEEAYETLFTLSIAFCTRLVEKIDLECKQRLAKGIGDSLITTKDIYVGFKKIRGRVTHDWKTFKKSLKKKINIYKKNLTKGKYEYNNDKLSGNSFNPYFLNYFLHENSTYKISGDCHYVFVQVFNDFLTTLLANVDMITTYSLLPQNILTSYHIYLTIVTSLIPSHIFKHIRIFSNKYQSYIDNPQLFTSFNELISIEYKKLFIDSARYDS